MKNFFPVCLFLGLVGSLISCEPENWLAGKTEVPLLPEIPYEYNDALPPHLDDGQSGTINDQLATLGRVLFYDEHLSALENISCGRCHQQRFAFSDGLSFSPGVLNEHTGRNTMQMVNVRMQTAFLWDMRAGTIPEQVLLPITNHIEMGITNLDALTERIAGLDYYPSLFTAAFGNAEVDQTKVSLALAEFVRAMVSYRSRYDEAFSIFTEELDTNFSTPEERLGFELFNNTFQCDKCHGGPNFAGSGGSDAANIGLDLEYADIGMAGWSGNPSFNGVFKVPSLRNASVTAPFMHDGRFATMEDAIEHYSSGIQPHENLDFRLVNALPDDPGIPGVDAGPGGFHMTAQQKHALIVFIDMLTDESFLTDNRYSDPFVLVDR